MTRSRQSFRNTSVLLLLLIMVIGLGGCRSTFGLFLPIDQHPGKMEEARRAAIQGNEKRLDSVLEDLRKSTSRSSRILYLLESARLKSLAGDTLASMELYAEAESLFDQELIRATFTVSESLQNAISVVTNDRALPYQGHLFERLFLSYFQSLNYLEVGDLTNARVEMNKALRDMRWGKENLPQLRRQSDQQLAQAGIHATDLPPGFGSQYGGVKLETSSDNALVYYLSGLLHQAGGDSDRAEIDYRNALAYAADPRPIHHAIETLQGIESDRGRLVVIHESDWVSSKISFSLPVFIRNRSYTLSFPYYEAAPYSQRYPEAFLHVGETTPVLSSVVNVDAAVRKALEEAFPGILLRQALRIVAKQEIQAEAHEADPWLGFASSIFSILSDQPDLRSWLSLPGAIHLADISLPAGTYDLSTDMGISIPEEVTLSPNHITLLRLVTAQGGVIRVDSFTIPSYFSEQ